MSTTSVTSTTVSVNQQSVGQAIRQLRIAYQGDDSKIAALNKVAGNLWACVWAWDASSKTLMVESATQTGLLHYHVHNGRCECKAAACGRQCWHAMAWEVMTVAETVQPVVKRFSSADLERIAREASELF